MFLMGYLNFWRMCFRRWSQPHVKIIVQNNMLNQSQAERVCSVFYSFFWQSARKVSVNKFLLATKLFFDHAQLFTFNSTALDNGVSWDNGVSQLLVFRSICELLPNLFEFLAQFWAFLPFCLVGRFYSSYSKLHFWISRVFVVEISPNLF